MLHVDRAGALRRLLLSTSALVACAVFAPAAWSQSVVISDPRTTEQNLDTLLPVGDPPTAQVTGTGSVIVPTIGGTAISASAQAWTLTNNGTVSADFYGVHFGLGGTITNAGDIDTQAAMQPGLTAIQIDGAFGSVTNSGTITGGNSRGIEMTQGGVVVNQSTGSIDAFGGGVKISGSAGTVTNDGTISSSTFNGVWLGAGGTVTNSGQIHAGAAAIHTEGGPGMVTNSGTLTGNNTVTMDGGGIFINTSDGVVKDTSNNNAVSIVIQAGTIDNAGSIEGTLGGSYATGVSIQGTLTNRATGSIAGKYNGVWVVTGSSTITASVENAGTITSMTHEAIEIDAANSIVTNSGTIMADNATAGLWVRNAGTVTNSGTIGSTSGLAINFSGGSSDNTLILDTGSVLVGDVQAGGGADVLIFHGQGVEVADKFLNFETLEMDGTDWTLSGDAIFSTGGQIAAGTLRVTGNITTPTLDVLGGGTLSGSGTVTGNVMASAGRVAPGSPATTLTVAGGLTMASDSTFHVDLDPTSASLVHVTGEAALQGGHIDVAFAPGNYTSGTAYNVLHSDTSVSGSFLEDTLAVGAFRFNVTYDDDDVFLTLARLAFGEICASRNQCGAGNALDRLGPIIPGDLGNVVDSLGLLDIPSQQAALASLAGDMHPTLARLALDGHALFGQSITRRLADRRDAGRQSASAGDGGTNIAMTGSHDGLLAAAMPGAPGAEWGAWMRGYGVVGTLDGDLNAAAANYFVGGLAAGIDRQFAPGLVAGFSFGYANTRADFAGSDTSGRIDSYDIGLYGAYQWAGFHLDAVASYAFLDNKTDRQIVVGDIVRQARASYHGQRYGLALDAGYDIDLGGVVLQPLVGGQYVHLRQNAFHEDGAGGLDLNGKRTSADSLRGSAGLKLGTRFDAGGVTLMPELRGRFEHEFLDTQVQTEMTFAGQPAAGQFTVVGATVPRDSIIVGGGLTALLSSWTTAFVDYDFKFNKDQKIHNLTAGIRFAF